MSRAVKERSGSASEITFSAIKCFKRNENTLQIFDVLKKNIFEGLFWLKILDLRVSMEQLRLRSRLSWLSRYRFGNCQEFLKCQDIVLETVKNFLTVKMSFWKLSRSRIKIVSIQIETPRPQVEKLVANLRVFFKNFKQISEHNNIFVGNHEERSKISNVWKVANVFVLLWSMYR